MKCTVERFLSEFLFPLTNMGRRSCDTKITHVHKPLALKTWQQLITMRFKPTSSNLLLKN
ncbi:hypothetical protein AB205_0180030 [Aquarana catesbeiana]|uniref:Uncharacterized protein n=1 Tax=Aquarana catesbeiana TaxID=8400 RepID=A0A2G9RM33_AQUCT|nr:hypothetical protein AB205_0180030 [Aquarana catesbeiana]